MFENNDRQKVYENLKQYNKIIKKVEDKGLASLSDSERLLFTEERKKYMDDLNSRLEANVDRITLGSGVSSVKLELDKNIDKTVAHETKEYVLIHESKQYNLFSDEAWFRLEFGKPVKILLVVKAFSNVYSEEDGYVEGKMIEVNRVEQLIEMEKLDYKDIAKTERVHNADTNTRDL